MKLSFGRVLLSVSSFRSFYSERVPRQDDCVRAYVLWFTRSSEMNFMVARGQTNLIVRRRKQSSKMRGKLAVSVFLFFSTWRGSFVAVVGIFPKFSDEIETCLGIREFREL